VASQVRTYVERAFRCVESYETAHHDRLKTVGNRKCFMTTTFD